MRCVSRFYKTMARSSCLAFWTSVNVDDTDVVDIGKGEAERQRVNLKLA